MKKIILVLCFMFFLLTGCKEKNIDSIYKEFIKSDYFKGTLSVTVDNETEKLGTLEMGDNSFLLQLEGSTYFLYINSTNNAVRMYMNKKYTTLDIPFTGTSITNLPILIKEK